MFGLTRRQALLAGASGLLLLAGSGQLRLATAATPKKGGSVAIGIAGAPPTRPTGSKSSTPTSPSASSSTR